MNNRIKWFAVGLVGISLLAGCQKNESSSTSKQKEAESTLKTTALAEISSMDTALAVDGVSQVAINTVFEGLYTKDKNDQVVPGLIEKEPTFSDNSKVITFKLKKDAKWSNNDPVTAKDFVYAWQRIVNPETSSPRAETLTAVLENGEAILNGKKPVSDLGVKAVDNNTLEIRTVSPQPYLKEILSNSAFFPQNEKFVKQAGEAYGTSSKTLLSNGPFNLKDWKATGTSWSYAKNESYWNKKSIHLTKIDIDVIKETSTALNLYHDGKLDLVNLMSDATIGEEDKKDLVTTPTANITGLLLNQKRNNEKTPLENENIRLAISKGFDKKSYTTLQNNGSVPLNGLIPSDFAQDPDNDNDFRKENGEISKFDVKEAQKSWLKGLKELGVDKVELEILGDDLPSAKRSLEFLQNQLQENLPGLTIRTRNVPFKNRLEAFIKQDYDLMLQGFLADYSDPMNYLELFTAENENNRSSYQNNDYDQLIDSAKATNLDEKEKRWEDMKKAEKILLDTGGFAPIYQRYNSYLKKNNVQDVLFPMTGYDVDYRFVQMKS